MPETLAHHQQPESWGDKAHDYESIFAPFSKEVARRAIEMLGLQPGDRFLDVAAGTGAVTLAAHAAGARVTAIDFAPGMLEVLRTNLERGGIADVDVQHMDGQALDFDDSQFAAAGSCFGVVFFPSPEQGLREMHRVVRPGGKAFISGTGHPGSSQLQQFIGTALAKSLGPGAPAPRRGAAFTPDGSTLTRWMEAAGFANVALERIIVPWPVPDPQAFWDKWALRSPPSTAAMRQVPEAIRQRAGEEFVRFVQETGQAQFDTEVFMAIGTA